MPEDSVCLSSPLQARIWVYNYSLATVTERIIVAGRSVDCERFKGPEAFANCSLDSHL